jgi:hypothetical protein
MKKQTITYRYKTGSNQAYAESNWIGTDCLSGSYISIFAADGFTKEDDAKKIPFKSVSGNGNFYTNCNADGAKYTTIGFAASENPRLVSFSIQKTGKNATISATMEAYLLTQDCVVESYYDDFDDITYYYYICDDATTESYVNITVDSFLRVSPGADLYTTKAIETSTTRGTVTKFESKSSCESAVVKRKVIRIGTTRLNIPSFSTYGEICKVSSGYVSTTKFV